tara:strand:+ start:73 stop:357 length:285 start_codon:yes stop_codon:yes gene_type:complete
MDGNTTALMTTLKVQQENMSEDMKDVRSALKDIAQSLKTLSVLEAKYLETRSRMDDHEARIRKLELSIASNLWVERVMWVTLAGFVSMGVRYLV